MSEQSKKSIAELLPEGWIGFTDIDGAVLTNGTTTIRTKNDGSAEVDLDGKITMIKKPFDMDEMDGLIQTIEGGEK